MFSLLLILIEFNCYYFKFPISFLFNVCDFFFNQEFDQTGNNKIHPLNDDDKSNKSDVVEKGLVVAKIPKEGSDNSLDSGEEKKDISKEDTENIGGKM